MKLTAKQEAFAQAVADGMTQADAYRKAYDAGKMKPETVQNKAHVLMKNGEVAARVKTLRASLQEKALWTRQDSVVALAEIARGGNKPAEVTAAIKELNAMHGFNAPTKHELAVQFPRTIQVVAGRSAG